MDGHHSSKEIMHGTHEYAAEYDPEICGRTVGCTCNGSEDRTETCDIEELDHKDFPRRDRRKVHTISLFVSRSLSRRIHIEIALNNLSVNEIACNKKQDSN